jgi:hypothetical protein
MVPKPTDKASGVPGFPRHDAAEKIASAHGRVPVDFAAGADVGCPNNPNVGLDLPLIKIPPFMKK